jgi:hypothetical protein
MRIAFFTRPRQLHDVKLPVRNANWLMQFEEADWAAINDVLGEQLTALLKPTAPALGGGILVAAQGDMVGRQRRNI